MKIYCSLSNLSMWLFDDEKKLDQCGMTCSWLMYITWDSSPCSFPGAYKWTFSRKTDICIFSSSPFPYFCLQLPSLDPKSGCWWFQDGCSPLSFFELFKFPAWNATKPIWKQLIYVFGFFSRLKCYSCHSATYDINHLSATDLSNECWLKINQKFLL